MTPEAVGQELQVDQAKGLSAAVALHRLQKYCPSQLAEEKKEPDIFRIITFIAKGFGSILHRGYSAQLTPCHAYLKPASS
jgi:hypothetical protein